MQTWTFKSHVNYKIAQSRKVTITRFNPDYSLLTTMAQEGLWSGSSYGTSFT
jgi:hypothetical protein